MASSRRLPPMPWFPLLDASNHEVTSEPDLHYNCIAWAAGDEHSWWWPIAKSDEDEVFWPAGVPREVTLAAFVTAFATLGYQECAGAAFEEGFDRIALFILDGKPTHAARQLEDGRWSSKLGGSEDIAHELNALDGPVYGTPTVFLRRPRA